MCLVLLYPSVQKVTDDEAWPYAANNLKQVALALMDYQAAYRKFPPAVVRDKAGRPLYSWRVLVLPFLEQQRLYEQFHLDEPWDSEHNKQFLKETPSGYSTMGLGQNPP